MEYVVIMLDLFLPQRFCLRSDGVLLILLLGTGKCVRCWS